MAGTTARITGVVRRIERKTGTSGTGKEYDFSVAKINVADEGFTEVTFSGPNHDRPTVGETVDVMVDIDVWQGRLQIKAVNAFPALVA